jgi:hypothetical protein
MGHPLLFEPMHAAMGNAKTKQSEQGNVAAADITQLS